MFDDALAFASQLHRDQRRKGTDIPYISHPLGVCAIVLEHGGMQDEAIGALLHDALEDQGDKITAAGIEERFNAQVRAIVQGCTDGTGDRGPDTWRARKEAYIQHLYAEQNRSVLLVSLADKLHNASTILRDLRTQGVSVFDRFNSSQAGVLWYYGAVRDAFAQNPRSPESLVTELSRVVEQITAS